MSLRTLMTKKNEAPKGRKGGRQLETLVRLTLASRRGESSAQTGGEFHGGGTAAARGGGERPVLGRGR